MEYQNKIAWFHPPKTGTSFATAVFGYGSNYRISSQDIENLVLSWSPLFQKYDPQKYLKNTWVEKKDHLKISEDVFQKFKGFFVGIFREPVDRSISSFEWFHQCTKSFAYCKSKLIEYINLTGSTVVRMLAGQDDGTEWKCMKNNVRFPCESYDEPQPNIQLAKLRLNSFKFVGLQSEWTLSICLFHHIFGGSCDQIELKNIRKTKSIFLKQFLNDEQIKKIKNNNSFSDSTLYYTAQKRFWNDIHRFDLNHTYCKSFCHL